MKKPEKNTTESGHLRLRVRGCGGMGQGSCGAGRAPCPDQLPLTDYLDLLVRTLRSPSVLHLCTRKASDREIPKAESCILWSRSVLQIVVSECTGISPYNGLNSSISAQINLSQPVNVHTTEDETSKNTSVQCILGLFSY